MVRKITSIFCLLLVISSCFATVTQAQTFTVYDNGNISSTYVTYFRDISSGLKFTDKYVAFRSGQYEYTMLVGNISYSDNSFNSSDILRCYTFSSDGNYGSYYHYNVSDVEGMTLNSSDVILYSNLGDFPQLEERGAKFEAINTLLITIFMLCIVVNRIFFTRKRIR